jgi:hypothetical protein
MRIDSEYMKKTLCQFALDYNVDGGEWITDKIHLSPVNVLEGARLHVKHDTFFKAAIIMGKAYVMADEVMHPWIKEILAKEPPEWWCDFKNLKKLESELNKYGREIFDTHIYFLPSEEPTMERPRFAIKWFEKEELEQFRNDKRFNTYSLSFSPTQPDVLAVVAYDGKESMAMAGCSEDGKYLWQIGVDCVAGYEGRGLARNLVTLLKQEIIARGKVPYYGTAESHAISRNVAIGSGFLPAWCEIQVRKSEE